MSWVNDPGMRTLTKCSDEPAHPKKMSTFIVLDENAAVPCNNLVPRAFHLPTLKGARFPLGWGDERTRQRGYFF